MATSEMDYMGGDYIIGPAHINNTTNRQIVFDNLSDNEAFEKICAEHTESTRSQLYEILKDLLKEIPADVDTAYKSIY